tara:strand:+ start:3611 stop:3844 length:234 start_codon:yes stop_codon:yes gene_type:complete
MIKNHLYNYGKITSWEAITKYKATRLSGIIFNLKADGWPIESEIKKTQYGSFAEYSIDVKSSAWKKFEKNYRSYNVR